MGTRHLIEVIHNGETKVAQYGQWDGYPSGQGVDILKFLRTRRLDKFAEAVDKCRFVTDATIRQYYVDAGDSPDNTSGFVDIKISETFKRMHPALSRDAGTKVLDIILESQNGTELLDSRSFAEDTLFCEFAYVINLDDGKLYCYETGKTKKFYECSIHEVPSDEEFLNAYKIYSNEEDED